MQKASERKPAQQLLQFNVAQLLKQPINATRAYDLTDVALPNLPDNLVLRQPLAGHIKLTKSGEAILVTGNLHTALSLPCTRCLTPVDVPVSVEIEEIFTPTVEVTTGIKLKIEEDADPATLISDAHVLDLSEVIRQNLYLDQPSKVLCRPDCLGICPQCGQNRNEVACTCADDPIDSRWADLLAMKDDNI